jgi:hypothetical protein
MPRRKDVDHRLAGIAVTAEDRQLRWSVIPDWACEAGIAFLWAYRQPEQVAAVTKAEYLAALKAHLPEALADGGAAAWALFQDRVHERGEFAPGAAEKRRAEWQRQRAHGVQATPGLLDGLDLDANDLDPRSTRARTEAEDRWERQAEQERTRYRRAWADPNNHRIY